MNEGAHILLALALVALVLRAEGRTAYLVAVAAAIVPMAEVFLVNPLVTWGYLSGVTWTHRSILHSLLVGLAVVAVAWYVGYWRAGALGYAAALVPDLFFGGVKLFLPIDATVYGMQVTHTIAVTGVVVFLSGLVIAGAILFDVRDRVAEDWPRPWSTPDQQSEHE